MARPRIKIRRRTAKLHVRRATPRDLDVLVRQRRAMWMDLGIRDLSLHRKADADYKRWARPRLKSRRLMAWLVEDAEGTTAGGGCLWLQPLQPSPRRIGDLQPYLLSMYTEPRFRRQGVASLIISEAIEWCGRHGYGRLTLHASEMGEKVYEKFGFKRTREMRLDLEKGVARLPFAGTGKKRGSTTHAA